MAKCVSALCNGAAWSVLLFPATLGAIIGGCKLLVYVLNLADRLVG